jgi:acyl-CoA hydrolase
MRGGTTRWSDAGGPGNVRADRSGRTLSGAMHPTDHASPKLPSPTSSQVGGGDGQDRSALVTVTAVLSTVQNVVAHAASYGGETVVARDVIPVSTALCVPVLIVVASVFGRGWGIVIRGEEQPMSESSGGRPVAESGTADVDRHRLSMTILMTPDMSNFAGNVHGGILLKYLDQVAYTCATRYARRYAVTLSVDQVVFREPVHVGELVTFDASVNRTGRTSMEVGVRVTTQDLVHQTVRHTNSCYFTMVALDSEGRPAPVPPWHPRTADERRRQLAAERRSQLRREIDRATREIKQPVPDDTVTGQGLERSGVGKTVQDAASSHLSSRRVT